MSRRRVEAPDELVGEPASPAPLKQSPADALPQLDDRQRGYVQTSRHTTAYLHAGPVDGPVIILVHGWPGLAVTWRHQIQALSALGFRVIAPDLRGCGHSSLYRTHSAFAQREIVRDMIELVDELGIDHAVWVGHDWGAMVVSNVAHHHPERCVGVCTIAMPLNTLEKGSAALRPLINRNIYPEDEFPAGQFEYMELYHEQFDAVQASFEANIATMMKAVMRRGDPAGRGRPYTTAFSRKQGGWFGPDCCAAPESPLDTAVLEEGDLTAYVQAYSRTGFFGINALYMNDKDNLEYFQIGSAQLTMPVLFLPGTYDFICDSEQSDLATPMRDACANFTCIAIPAGHWIPHERPAEVSAAICKWLVHEIPSHWPV